MKISATFAFERETKGAILYSEVNAKGEKLEMRDAKIGSIYLRKTAVGKEVPQKITVVVS